MDKVNLVYGGEHYILSDDWFNALNALPDAQRPHFIETVLGIGYGVQKVSANTVYPNTVPKQQRQEVASVDGYGRSAERASVLASSSTLNQQQSESDVEFASTNDISDTASQPGQSGQKMVQKQKERFWTEATNKLLIAEYRNRKHRFSDPKTVKKILWSEIANEFAARGYSITQQELNDHWRHLKSEYRKVRDAMNETGRGRDVHQRRFAAYYNDFEEMFGENDVGNVPKLVLNAGSTPYTEKRLCDATQQMNRFNGGNSSSSSSSSSNNNNNNSSSSSSRSNGDGESSAVIDDDQDDASMKSFKSSVASKSSHRKKKNTSSDVKGLVSAFETSGKTLDSLLSVMNEANSLQKRKLDLFERYLNQQSQLLPTQSAQPAQPAQQK